MADFLSRFTYTNHKLETEKREVHPLNVEFMPNPGFGYDPGFFLCALDPARGYAKRSFRLDERFKPLGEPDGEGTVIVAVCERGGLKSTHPLMASIAGKYLHYGQADLLHQMTTPEGQSQLVTAIRAMAACTLGQREPTDIPSLDDAGHRHVR